MTAMIEARDLAFAFGNRTILEKASFEVQRGEMVALLGANGAGKTTLLNLISGLLQPTSGLVAIHGRTVSRWTRGDLAKFAALVPQHLEVPFLFTVEEIVAQGRVPYLGKFGRMLGRDHEVIEGAMRSVDVLEMRDRVFAELSGGEKQRVKMAIALAQEPELLLLDEPTQHLDIGRQIEAVALLRRLNERGTTVLAAVHDLNLVRENFGKAILLVDRQCIAGPVEHVMKPDLLEKAYRVERASLSAYCEPEPQVFAEPTADRECRQMPRRRRGHFRR